MAMKWSLNTYQTAQNWEIDELIRQAKGAGFDGIEFLMDFGQKHGVEANEKIINPRGHVVPVSTDGRTSAAMRAQLHFDEYSSGWNPAAQTFAVDETTHLNCQIAGDDMRVSADVYGTRDGEPWFRAHWRADFRHYAE